MERHDRLRIRSLKSREEIARKRAMGKLKHAPPAVGMRRHTDPRV
jgi:hypothetical protein